MPIAALHAAKRKIVKTMTTCYQYTFQLVLTFRHVARYSSC